VSPKISICIPTYRQEAFLRRTLESIAIQSFKDYEVIVTDDSPDDRVEKTVMGRRWFDNLRYVRNAERLGAPGNWNRAVSLATGEYVKLLHHDDWFPDPESLGEFAALLDGNPAADFAFGATLVCGTDGEVKRVHALSPRELGEIRRDLNRLFPRNLIGSPSATIYRRSIGEEYDVTLKWVVDLEFYIRLLKKNGAFAYSARPLVCTVDGAPHQVTAECLGRREVELSEWVRLFQRLDVSGKVYWSHVRFFRELFERHDVRSLDELTGLGVKKPIPGIVRVLIRLHALRRRLSF